MAVSKKKPAAKKPAAKKTQKSEVSFESYEEAAKAKLTLTKQIAGARSTFSKFIKETGLKKAKDYSTDSKHGKKWSELKKAVVDFEQQRKDAINYMKENKPAKSGGGNRSTKHVYPKNIMELPKEEQTEAKKKHRTLIRAAAKRAGVGVDEYLSDPKGFDEKVIQAKKEKAESKAKKTPKKKEPKTKPNLKAEKIDTKKALKKKPAAKKKVKKKPAED